MSIYVRMPNFLDPKLQGRVLKIRRMPGHFVGDRDPIVDIGVGEHILTLCAPEAGKIMRCRSVGEIVTAGEPVCEVTTIGRPTWELFVAYRRADSPAHAGRIAEHAIAQFGPGQVFKDVESLQPGEDFPTVIRARIQNAFCMLVVIGPHWVDDPRLKDPEDLHRDEIRTALARGIQVLPVLVGGATMPRKEELPEDIGSLASRHAIEIRDSRWTDDVAYLAQHVEKALTNSPARMRFLKQVPPWNHNGPQWIADNPRD